MRLSSITPSLLRCEYRRDPLGINVIRPRLSWILESGHRNQVQTAYQILVASNADLLASGAANLWDTGKVDSDQTIHVEYEGNPLSSRAQCLWTVRVWDKDGNPSEWSEPARWTMGLLVGTDWSANWIYFDRAAASESNAALEDAQLRIGYISEAEASPDQEKWISLDLGSLQTIDAIQLHPVRRFLRDFGALSFINYDVGYLFPKKFVAEVASQQDFSDAVTWIDRSSSDIPNPGTHAPCYEADSIEARYVRLRFPRLRKYGAGIHGVALTQIRVFSGDKNVALGALVSASDSLETSECSAGYLVDGRAQTDDPIPRRPAVLARREFYIDKSVSRATVYVTALGLYELHINGNCVGDRMLAPEWTAYDKRVQYQTYDVADYVKIGNNVVGAVLGEGWYAGRVLTKPGISDEGPKLLLQLEVEYTDGDVLSVISDSSWRCTDDGPIRYSGLYDGEVYDARREMPEWDRSGFDEGTWHHMTVRATDDRKIEWQPNEPIRPLMDLIPEKVFETRPGVYVFDLGQNMAGTVRFKVKGPRGHTVTIRHAERLNPDGSLFYNLKGGLSEIRYTLRGDPDGEEYQPHFTYMGFRYVELTGTPSKPAKDAIIGRVFNSGMSEVGEFECSNSLINKLMSNLQWSLRGNFMGVPTDCPQRDERLGWMGDAQSTSGTYPFQLDVAAFFTKWLRDVGDSQADDGRFPDMSPQMYGPEAFYAHPAWGDAGIVCPWRMYEFYGDTRILSEHYNAAKKWVEWILQSCPDLIWRADGFPGDWLNGDRVFLEGYPRSGANTPGPEFGTLFFAHSVEILSMIAAVIGKDEDADHYRRLSAEIKDAFIDEFVSSDGLIASNTQGTYALALHFDVLKNELRKKAVKHMFDAFKPYDGHLSTGIQATHRLLFELTRGGHHDFACNLLTLRTPPSWGYMIDQGATTIWERWDGWVEGREEHPGFMGWMNSFNHFAYGAVGEWIWRNLVGINTEEPFPAFKHFLIAPLPGPGFRGVTGTYDSIRGKIRSAWEITGGVFELTVIIPPNTTAAVRIPTCDPDTVKESGLLAPQAESVEFLRNEPGAAFYEVSSGTYSFTATYSSSNR